MVKMSAFCHTVALAPRYRNGLVRFYAVALKFTKLTRTTAVKITALLNLNPNTDTEYQQHDNIP